MRSNDAIFGFMNDFVWHCHVYEKLLKDIQKIYPEVTSSEDGIIWNASSFHIYERHFKLLDTLCTLGE
jgi:thymidylate synthase